MVQRFADTEAYGDECLILDYFGLIKYEVNSLLGFSHLVDYISVHIRSDLERYLLISHSVIVKAVGGGGGGCNTDIKMLVTYHWTQ